MNLTKPYDYNLPAERIAQRPVYPYHDAKLMVVHRASGELVESDFWRIQEFFDSPACFVLNNTRVMPSRLFARNMQTGGMVELLLFEEREQGTWRAIGKPMKKFARGHEYQVLGDSLGLLRCGAERVGKQDELRVQFSYEGHPAKKSQVLGAGILPIPPYIRGGMSDQQDTQDYQSDFAERDGSVAAPTAGLHFTPELRSKLSGRGHAFRFATLHVGAASFQSLWEDGALAPRAPAEELCEFSPSLMKDLEEFRKQHQKIVAVGTTVVRALESMAQTRVTSDTSIFAPTDLFIQPGFPFQACDAVITNFHQARTTHMLLVEALLGRELLARAYEYALAKNFRFLSYGDGMLIL